MKIKCLLKYGKNLLSSIITSTLDVEILLSYVVKKPRTWIRIFDDYVLDKIQVNLFKKLLMRRLNHEPIAYIVQEKEFWSLPFIVSRDTLIPRPETEILVEQSLHRINNNDKILELGIGCGAISLSVKHAYEYCSIFGVDISYHAISLAKRNLKKLNLRNVFFFYSNWFSCVHEKFHLIISNPPYLNKSVFMNIEKKINFEPNIALFATKCGLQSINYIILHAQRYLLYKGWLLLEHSWEQTKIVQNIFKESNFNNIQSYQDDAGYDRVTVGQKI